MTKHRLIKLSEENPMRLIRGSDDELDRHVLLITITEGVEGHAGPTRIHVAIIGQDDTLEARILDLKDCVKGFAPDVIDKINWTPKEV